MPPLFLCHLLLFQVIFECHFQVFVREPLLMSVFKAESALTFLYKVRVAKDVGLDSGWQFQLNYKPFRFCVPLVLDVFNYSLIFRLFLLICRNLVSRVFDRIYHHQVTIF